MDENRKASLEAGRRKLEEFRKKKEAALAAKRTASAASSPVKSVDGSVIVTAPAAQPPGVPATHAQELDKYKNEAEDMKEQVSQLLQSVDQLHKSLNDERYNSQQLEEQLAGVRETHASYVTTSATELEETRAQALRYATAAETASMQLLEAQETNENLQTQLRGAADAETSVQEYKQRIAQLTEQVGASNDAAATASLHANEQVLALESEMERLKELNHRMKGELASQAAAAEAAVALEEAEKAALQAERSRVAELQTRIDVMKDELSTATNLAVDKDAEVAALRQQLEDSLTIAGANEGAMAMLQEQQTLLEELEGSLQAAQNEVVELKSSLETATAARLEHANVEAALREEIMVLQAGVGDVEMISNELNAVQTHRDELVKSIELARGAQQQAEHRVTEMLEALEMAQSTVADRGREAQEAVSALEALQAIHTESEAGAEEMGTLKAQLADTAGLLSTAQQERESLAAELASLVEQMESIIAEKEALTLELQQVQARATADVGAAVATAVEAAHALNASHAEGVALQTRLEEALIEKGEVQGRCASLEEQLLKEQRNAQDTVAQLGQMLEQSQGRTAELEAKITELETQIVVGASGAPQRSDGATTSNEIAALQAAVADSQLQCQQYAERIQHLEAAAAAASVPPDPRLQVTEERAIQAEQRSAHLQEENIHLRSHLEVEQRRAAQLEAFAERQRNAGAGSSGNKKDDDNGIDMEAAALSGGSAFKPLVGVVRSLPTPLSHSVVVAGARELDRVMVALDARPHIRAALVLYIACLHVMLLI